MKTIMVRYKTSPNHANSNETLVHAVFDELRKNAPAGFRYTTFRLDDGVTFVHLATLDAKANPLAASPAFQRFQKTLNERCVEPAVVSELTPVDSYGDRP